MYGSGWYVIFYSMIVASVVYVVTSIIFFLMNVPEKDEKEGNLGSVGK